MKVIVQGYKALQLCYFFTAGPDEVKAWTILKGTKAPQVRYDKLNYTSAKNWSLLFVIGPVFFAFNTNRLEYNISCSNNWCKVT